MPKIPTEEFVNFQAFWPYYLGQHSLRTTRLIHIIGTLLGLFAVVLAVSNMRMGWLVIALACGYGFAWLGHSMIEKNQPATFTYPLWSLRGDFHMLGLWLSGKLEAELVKYKIMT